MNNGGDDKKITSEREKRRGFVERRDNTNTQNTPPLQTKKERKQNKRNVILLSFPPLVIPPKTSKPLGQIRLLVRIGVLCVRVYICYGRQKYRCPRIASRQHKTRTRVESASLTIANLFATPMVGRAHHQTCSVRS